MRQILERQALGCYLHHMKQGIIVILVEVLCRMDLHTQFQCVALKAPFRRQRKSLHTAKPHADWV